VDQGPGAGILELLSAIVLLGAVVHHRSRFQVAAVGVVRRLHPPPPMPVGRPIELIARDARRLGWRFRCPQPGIRFVKYEALRRAYDDVLAEGCRAVGAEHLLEVLPPGAELDAERDRVECLLDAYGFGLPDVA
jgi:hypothetical protein